VSARICLCALTTHALAVEGAFVVRLLVKLFDWRWVKEVRDPAYWKKERFLFLEAVLLLWLVAPVLKGIQFL